MPSNGSNAFNGKTQLIWVWDACQAMCPVLPRAQPVRKTARDERVGTTGVSDGAIFRVAPDDERALQVISEDCRRRVRTAGTVGELPTRRRP